LRFPPEPGDPTDVRSEFELGKRWSELGSGRWFRRALWLLALGLLLYFAFRLGTALARRFRAIERSYDVVATGMSESERAPVPAPRHDESRIAHVVIE